MSQVAIKKISINDKWILSNAVVDFMSGKKAEYESSHLRGTLKDLSIAMELYDTVTKSLHSPKIWAMSEMERTKKNKKLSMKVYAALVMSEAINGFMDKTDNDFILSRCRDILDQLERKFI